MCLQKPGGKSYRRRAAPCALALIVCLMARPALSQTPTIEELEKRIEEARKAQAADAPAPERALPLPHSEDSDASAGQKNGQPARFDPLADGLLRDHRTGLIWSASDNGRDVDWDDASRYCTGRGMQLPTVGQLLRLVDRTGAMSTPCQARQCKVSGRFHLTGYGYWSRQREGERWAVFVTLDDGRRSFDYVGIRNNFRALCVRDA
jgi:hypothetical protein